MIHHFFIEDGVRKHEKVKFKPVMAYEAGANESSTWTDLFDRPLKLKKFDSMKDARNWASNAEGMFDVFGNINPIYQFISFNYPNEVPIQKEAMRIGNFDIECPSSKGFPKPEHAAWPIKSIAFQDMVNDQYTVLGLKGDYKPSADNIHYVRFETEAELLEGFILFLIDFQADILTGWNIETFDIPYLVNRIRKILGESAIKRLSPIGVVNNRTMKSGFNGKEENVYDIVGITVMDYLELYKKFSRNVRESYALDHISKMELGEGKLDFSDVAKNHWELFEKDFQRAIEYNIVDCRRVFNIDQRLLFIDLIISVGYMAHAQFSDCMGTVKIWDALLYNKLLHKKVMVPPVKRHMKKSFPGGFVMDPRKGLHDWLDMFDLESSYPNQTRTWNISPETIVEFEDLHDDLKAIREKYNDYERDSLDVDNLAGIQETLQKHNVSFTANGEFYRLEKEGIIPETMGEIFNSRVVLKHRAQEIEDEIKQLEKQIEELEAA